MARTTDPEYAAAAVVFTNAPQSAEQRRALPPQMVTRTAKLTWTTEMRIGNAHPAFKRENIRPRFLLQLRLRITMVNVHLTTHVWSAEGLVEHRYCRGQGG